MRGRWTRQHLIRFWSRRGDVSGTRHAFHHRYCLRPSPVAGRPACPFAVRSWSRLVARRDAARAAGDPPPAATSSTKRGRHRAPVGAPALRHRIAAKSAVSQIALGDQDLRVTWGSAGQRCPHSPTPDGSRRESAAGHFNERQPSLRSERREPGRLNIKQLRLIQTARCAIAACLAHRIALPRSPIRPQPYRKMPQRQRATIVRRAQARYRAANRVVPLTSVGRDSPVTI